MTIGDVMAVVGIILGICLSLWVMLISTALLFDDRAQAAKLVWANEAKRALAVGIFAFAVLGVGGIILLNAPGALKLLGWVFLLTFLAISMLGGSGLALLMGQRTAAQDAGISSLTALARGAGMMALAWIFPVLGWFLVAPVCVIMGAGAGAKSLRGRKVKLLEEAGLMTSSSSPTLPMASGLETSTSSAPEFEP